MGVARSACVWSPSHWQGDVVHHGAALDSTGGPTNGTNGRPTRVTLPPTCYPHPDPLPAIITLTPYPLPLPAILTLTHTSTRYLHPIPLLAILDMHLRPNAGFEPTVSLQPLDVRRGPATVLFNGRLPLTRLDVCHFNNSERAMGGKLGKGA